MTVYDHRHALPTSSPADADIDDTPGRNDSLIHYVVYLPSCLDICPRSCWYGFVR